MNVIRETMLALFFAGWLIFIALRVGMNTSEHLINTQYTVINQENLQTLTDIIEYDIRKIGHGLINPFTAITLADSNRFIFSYDKDPSKNYDSIRVEYSLVRAVTTPNVHDKILYRKLNSHNTTKISLGISRFKLKYYNRFGKELPTPVVSDSLSKIREIEISLTIESRDLKENKYGNSKYVTRIVPKNLLIQY